MPLTEIPPMSPPPAPSTRRRLAAAAGFFIGVVVTALIGLAANRGNVDGWYAEAERAPWSPPNAIFGPVWSILYVLIAIAGYVLWRRGFSGPGRESDTRSLQMLFVAQLVLNAMWPPLFFAAYPSWGPLAWWLALVVIVLLVVLVAWLIVACLREHIAVSLLLVPYLLWLLFATTLNAAVIALN